MEQIKIPEKFYTYFEQAGRSVRYKPGETENMQNVCIWESAGV